MDFITDTQWDDLPLNICLQSKLCLLDLIGVAVCGATTDVSKITGDYAVLEMSGPLPMIFDGLRASVAGVTLAGWMTIDALDDHDGSIKPKVT